MKVFLSWSSELSHKIAKEFRDWLPMVIQSTEPYVSSEDIDKGTRWSVDIATELQDSSFGILFVTKDNLKAPWLNFEAGALSKSFDSSRVTPFLFDIKASDMSGSPLLQFQSTSNDKEDIKKLIHSINNVTSSDKIPENKINLIFDKWWPDLEAKLKDLKNHHDSTSTHDPKPKPKDKQQEILEEILELSRNQQKILINSPILLSNDLKNSNKELLLDINNSIMDTLHSLRILINEVSESESLDKNTTIHHLSKSYTKIQELHYTVKNIMRNGQKTTVNPF